VNAVKVERSHTHTHTHTHPQRTFEKHIRNTGRDHTLVTDWSWKHYMTPP